MDLGKYMEIKELEKRFYILDLPVDVENKICNIVYDFRSNNDINISVYESRGRSKKYKRIEMIEKIHLYDAVEKIITEFRLEKININYEFAITEKSNVYTDYELSRCRIYEQVKETVEAMFGHGLFDGDDEINYTPEQIKELLKNYE